MPSPTRISRSITPLGFFDASLIASDRTDISSPFAHSLIGLAQFRLQPSSFHTVDRAVTDLILQGASARGNNSPFQCLIRSAPAGVSAMFFSAQRVVSAKISRQDFSVATPHRPRSGLLRLARRLQKDATERCHNQQHKDVQYKLGRQQPFMTTAYDCHDVRDQMRSSDRPSVRPATRNNHRRQV